MIEAMVFNSFYNPQFFEAGELFNIPCFRKIILTFHKFLTELKRVPHTLLHNYNSCEKRSLSFSEMTSPSRSPI